MSLEFVPLAHYGLDRAAAVLSRGFEDYLVKIASSSALLLHLARSDSVDLLASRVVLREGDALGAALVARRGWTCRLAGMALVREARRQGVGRTTVIQLIDEARDRGERAMVLEVIEQNDAAVKLYESCGFKRVRRLVSYSLVAAKAAEVGAAGEFEEIDLREFATAVTANGLTDLPWQLSGETLAQLTPPTVAYRFDGAGIALAGLSTPQVTIRGMVTEQTREGRGSGIALLRALVAEHPGKDWRMEAMWPEELSELFIAAGFVRSALSQWQMIRELN